MVHTKIYTILLKIINLFLFYLKGSRKFMSDLYQNKWSLVGWFVYKLPYWNLMEGVNTNGEVDLRRVKNDLIKKSNNIYQ